MTGIGGLTPLIGYQGESSGAIRGLVAGRWLDGPGEAVVTGRFLTASHAGLGDTLTVTNGDRTAELEIVGEAFFLTDDGMTLLTGMSTLADLGLPADATQFHVFVDPGTDVDGYLTDLRADLPMHSWASETSMDESGVIVAMDALIVMLTLLLVVAGGLGVLNTVLLDTRERAHDLGIVKALGMTPQQVLAMVLTSVAGIGVVAATIGVPLGVALHHMLVPRMVGITGARLPAGDIAVYQPGLIVLLILGGAAVAIVGALAPAAWAATARTVTTLRAQ